MWLSRNIFLLLFLALCTGCQFHPLYDDPTVVKDLEQIKINLIADRTGQLLRNRLEQLLTPYGVPEKPKYTLTVTQNFTRSDYGYLNDATATRSRIILTANYTLRDHKTGKVITQNTITTSADFNLLTGADYATVVVDENAYKRAIALAADQIKLLLARYFTVQKDSQEAANESAPENTH